MKHLFAPLLLLSLVVCGLTGCSSTTEMISAGLRIEVAQVQRESSGNIQVTWRVKNPNVVPYLFTKSSHKLTLNGTLVGTFADAAPLGVPSSNQADRTSALVPANAAGAQVIEQALTQGSAAYRLESTLWVLIIDEDTEKIPLSATGTVPVGTK